MQQMSGIFDYVFLVIDCIVNNVTQCMLARVRTVPLVNGIARMRATHLRFFKKISGYTATLLVLTNVTDD